MMTGNDGSSVLPYMLGQQASETARSIEQRNQAVEISRKIADDFVGYFIFVTQSSESRLVIVEAHLFFRKARRDVISFCPSSNSISTEAIFP